MGRASLLASSIFRLTGLSKRFSRDGAVMMIIGTAELFNDEGGEEDDDKSLLRDSSTVRMKKSTILSSLINILQMNTVTLSFLLPPLRL